MYQLIYFVEVRHWGAELLLQLIHLARRVLKVQLNNLSHEVWVGCILAQVGTSMVSSTQPAQA